MDSLCQPFAESGNPVQFYPVENYPLGVKVSWEPTQEGEGDPSPDNIRPITGRDSVTITHSNDIVSNDYNIALPETVYGGTLDVETGVVTVDYHTIILDGGEVWVVSINNNYYVWWAKTAIPTAVSAGNGYCTHYIYRGNNNEVMSMYVQNNGAVAIFNSTDDYPTLYDWKSYLAAQYAAGTPVQVCYKLATPYTIQLTPQQITALSGVNTLYADAGTLTITGREDPKHTITELKNAIISLGGNV